MYTKTSCLQDSQDGLIETSYILRKLVVTYTILTLYIVTNIGAKIDRSILFTIGKWYQSVILFAKIISTKYLLVLFCV